MNYLNQFSNHHSLVYSSAHGFKSNFIGSFLLNKKWSTIKNKIKKLLHEHNYYKRKRKIIIFI